MVAIGFLLAVLIGAANNRIWFASAASLNESINMRDCQPVANPILVLLLTYHRSGSSYVGELLAAQHNASYFFEPLFYSDFKLLNRTSEFRRNYLRRLMDCDSALLDKLRGQDKMIIVRKFLDTWDQFRPSSYSSDDVARYCRCSPIRVIKTIRLRLDEAVPLLDTMPGLHIVNLVRDPRARYASVVAPGGYWSEEERSVRRICSDMALDTETARMLLESGSTKYLRVRYEDVVADPEGTVRAIYRNLLQGNGTSDHRRVYPIGETDPHDYYSTYRLSTFDPNHWRKTLNASVIARVQAACGSLIENLGYSHINGNKINVNPGSGLRNI